MMKPSSSTSPFAKLHSWAVFGAMALSALSLAAPATAQVTATPAKVAFGRVILGTKAKIAVTLTNACSCTETISTLKVTDAVFTVTAPTLPIKLAQGQTTSITVTFTPLTTVAVEGSVELNGTLLTIPFSGTGITTGFLGVTPAPLNFGNVSMGTKAVDTLTLHAYDGNVTVSAATSSNKEFTFPSTTFPLALTSGESVSVQVLYTPTATGSATGTLTFVNNGATINKTEAVEASAGTPYVTLTWVRSTSEVEGYNVYRGTSSSGPFSRLNSSVDTEASYVDSTVALSKTYYYATTAVGTNGKESGYSNLVEVTIP
jgi:Abnormal spindle-like microcephaly-assoc'd, ASPM-SPD-2-Hydin